MVVMVTGTIVSTPKIGVFHPKNMDFSVSNISNLVVGTSCLLFYIKGLSLGIQKKFFENYYVSMETCMTRLKTDWTSLVEEYQKMSKL